MLRVGWRFFGPNMMFADLRCSPSCTHAGIHGTVSICPPDCFQYKGTLDIFYKIIRQYMTIIRKKKRRSCKYPFRVSDAYITEGVARLWRGTNAGLALAIPTVGIYLPCYDVFRNWLEELSNQNYPSLTPYVPLVAGSLAQSLACTTCYPVELARTRMQAFKQTQNGQKPPGVLKTLLGVLSNVKGTNNLQSNLQSYRALWTGLGAQLARDVPYSAICWSTLEPTRRKLLRIVGEDTNAVGVFGANFSAGLELFKRSLSTFPDEPELKEFNEYMENLKNYEKSGVPRNAGTDSDDGFDLGRMRRLMDRLGNPQSKFKAVHIAGTKGKGSTAAFLSNILRAEGYSVGCYTSPHIRTIRERIIVGKSGEPVSAKALTCLFHKVHKIVDEAMKLENGHLSHFEILTAMAFTLFAQENVDIAVIEAGLGGARDATNIISSYGLVLSVITTISEEHLVALGGTLESIAMAKSGIIKYKRPLVLGGPFLPHVEQILRDKASSMCSPVVSASDPANRRTLKSFKRCGGKPCQSCDMMIKIENDFPLSIELPDVDLSMLGNHQLQNAATATCAALCLRDQGWRVADKSVRAGLESTYLLGRSQFLTSMEAAGLGLPGTTILLDGAHTKDSAKALVDTIRMTFPEARLGLVVAMASDKDHVAFASELLSGGKIEVVFLTEADIAGGKSRIASAASLQQSWVQASKELGISILHDGLAEYETVFKDQSVCSSEVLEQRTILAAESSLPVSMSVANQILKARTGDQSGIIVVTGSLHIVSSVLASLDA